MSLEVILMGKKQEKEMLFKKNHLNRFIYLSSYSTMFFQITPHGILIGTFNTIQTGLIYDCNKELPN